jgi:hypothetical protein
MALDVPATGGKHQPKIPFGHRSFHSRSAFTTMGGMGIAL